MSAEPSYDVKTWIRCVEIVADVQARGGTVQDAVNELMRQKPFEPRPATE